MNNNYIIPESVVIVRNQHGASATLSFKDKRKDRILSSSSANHNSIYQDVERYVLGKVFIPRKPNDERTTAQT